MTHDEKIVEAVARAICRQEGLHPEDTGLEGEPYWENYCPHARAAITAYQAEAWQPIETAPRDHFPRLTWSLNQGQSVAFLDVTWAWWSVPNGDGPMKHPPTHWQPLSPAPNPPASP